MPVIDFTNCDEVYFDGIDVQQVFVGDQRVWKKARTVRNTFFTYGLTNLNHQTGVVVYTPSFESLGIRATDVTHYIGKSGKRYPISLEHRIYSATINVPYSDMYGQYDHHTLVLRN